MEQKFYRPKCGPECPLWPRMCIKRHPDEFFAEVDLEYVGDPGSGSDFIIRKRFFTSCSIVPEPKKERIPVDPADLPNEAFVAAIPVRYPDEE